MEPGQPLIPASRWPLLAGVFLGICLSLYLYADSLSLPYLQEDSRHIRWLAWHNPIEPFFSAAGAPAYRPLGKSIMKIWYLVLGHHDRAWLRYHNFAFNILNVALTGRLAAWFDRRRQRYVTGGLAALLFGGFPFAYQAVPWINNFFYPLENFLLLAMTAVYWQARLRSSNKLLALALFLCFLAPFEIEYGAMASSLLLIVEVVLWLQKRQPRLWLGGPLLGLSVNVLYVIRWFTIPKETYAFGFPTLNRIFLISTYFLQGLIYPASPAAYPLMAQLGMKDVTAIWLVSLPVLLILVVFLLHQRQTAILIMGLFWFALLNLPALVFVNFDYVVNSPRLLYPAGPGIVWLWGAFLAGLATSHRRPLLKKTAVSVFVIIVLAVNINFVQRIMYYYHLAEQPVHQLTAVARATPANDQLLVVNFPSWLTPLERTFAMGNHGIQIIPFYIDIQDLIYAHNGVDHPARAIQFKNISQSQPYYFGMLGETVDYDKMRRYLEASGDVYLARWGAETINLVRAGRATGIKLVQPTASFDEAITLELAASEMEEQALTLTLNWQIQQKIERDLTVFVHLYGPDGQLITQDDGYLLQGMAPFWLWDAGQTLQDTRTLIWPTDAPAGVYRVGVGVYDPASGLRLPAFDAAGRSFPDNTAILLSVER